MGHRYVLVIADEPDEALYPYAEYAEHDSCEPTPEVHFDYYGVCDQAILKLIEPRQPGFIRRLIGAKPKSVVSQAYRREIDISGSKLGRIAAVVVGGKWCECPFVADDSSEMGRWDEQVRRLLSDAPEDMLISVFDIHS